MRAIDADALEKAISVSHSMIDDYGIKTGYEICMRLVENAPTIEPERKTGKWIPCSERMPKDEIAYYLVTLVDHDGLLTYGDVDIARWDYDRRKGKESWHWCKEREVIAWMPLPGPYKGGELE